MTLTIHSILNCMLWSIPLALLLSALSRNKSFLCCFGTVPLVILSDACLIRCCLPVELRATTEIGVTTLNPLHRLINRAAGSVNPEPWFYEIWLVGAAIAFALWLPRYTLQLLAVRRMPSTSDPRVSRVCQQSPSPMPRVVVSPKVCTPCVIGLWRETILLPETHYSASQLDLIIRHECAHIRHRDGLLDFILRILCSIFWWNPGILICRAVIVRLCDHRCDREVLQSASPSTRRFYCRTLVAFAVRQSSSTRHFAAFSLKSRFYMILYRESKTKKRDVITAVFIMISLLLISYLVILQPSFQPDDEDYMEHAVSGGSLEQNADGSYTIHTESGDYIIPASEAAALDRDQFPVQE